MKENEGKGIDRERRPNPALKYAGMAGQLMAILLAGVWLGFKLDELTGLKPLFLILLPLTALCFSLWKLVRSFNKPKQ